MRQYCVNVTGTTPEAIWDEIRAVYGPTNLESQGVLAMRDNDISEWNDWIIDHGDIEFDVWLIWKLSIGTNYTGNLSKRLNNVKQIGHCYSPCPYSTQSDDVRTRIMLGLSDTDPLPMKVDHTIGQVIYYMKTAYSGRWGFECSFGSDCPGFANGHNYIHV